MIKTSLFNHLTVPKWVGGGSSHCILCKYRWCQSVPMNLAHQSSGPFERNSVSEWFYSKKWDSWRKTSVHWPLSTRPLLFSTVRIARIPEGAVGFVRTWDFGILSCTEFQCFHVCLTIPAITARVQGRVESSFDCFTSWVDNTWFHCLLWLSCQVGSRWRCAVASFPAAHQMFLRFAKRRWERSNQFQPKNTFLTVISSEPRPVMPQEGKSACMVLYTTHLFSMVTDTPLAVGPVSPVWHACPQLTHITPTYSYSLSWP